MAEKEEKKEAEGAEVKEAPPKKSKKKLIIIIVAVLLIAGGAAAFLLLGSKHDKKETAAEETEEPRHLKTLKLDPFIVNLSEAKSFLKLSILVEIDETLLTKLTAATASGGHGGGGAGEGEGGAMPPIFSEKEARIRDKVIAILSSKTPSDVLSVTGKQALKDEVIEGINEILELPEPIVVNVYFTEFIVQ